MYVPQRDLEFERNSGDVGLLAGAIQLGLVLSCHKAFYYGEFKTV